MSVQWRFSDQIRRDGSTPTTGELPITGSAQQVISTSFAAGVVRSLLAVSYVAANILAEYIKSSQTVTLEVGGTNEQQTITISGGVTGGTFPLTYSGQTVTGIAWNASASIVQAALESLSNIAVGDVTVTGATPAWTVEFKGNLGLQNVAAMTTSAASLTGGVPAIAVTTPVPGVAASQTFTLIAGQVFTWKTGDIFTNPLSGTVTLWSVTNAGLQQAAFEAGILI